MYLTQIRAQVIAVGGPDISPSTIPQGSGQSAAENNIRRKQAEENTITKSQTKRQKPWRTHSATNSTISQRDIEICGNRAGV